MKIRSLLYGKVNQAMNKASRRGVKCLTFMMLLLSFTLGAKANPIDMRQAREVGAKFISANTATKVASGSDLQWVTTYRTTNNVAAFYVFNTTKGYVIVSADDCATPILAYSDENQFDPNDLPEAMQAYLMGFVKQIQYGIEHHLRDEAITRQWELVRSEGMVNLDRSNRSVSPLLTCTWGQGSNGYMYNMYCPADSNGPNGHTLTGCTATAMAQIMYYWGYPTQGVGSHSYTPSGYSQQTANFGTTTYNWANMPDALNTSSTSTQNDAVATLMWHCGVALEAEYGPYVTSAYESAVSDALTSYFKYSTDAEFVWQSDYTDAQWLAMVKGDLDLGRPIHYRGANSENGDGHMFVLDGYDANNLIHINWGWNGGYNNYFALGAFIPASDYDFSYYNCAVFHIHPNCDSSTTYQVTLTTSPSYGGMVSGAGTFSCGDQCTLTATPLDGYNFVNWTQDGSVVSSSATYTFTVESDMNLVANFAEGLIGNGTTSNSYLPSYSYYNYTLSQQIYTADELGEAGIINSIAFYNSGTEKTRSYDFYLKTTTKSTFSSGTDWETVSESDLVFSGSVTMIAGGWTVITLDTPFNYDGQSNLVLVTDDNTGSWESGMKCLVFDAPSQAIRIYSDGTNYDPFNPGSYSGTVMNVKNQLLVSKATPAPTMQVFADYYPDANNPLSPYVKVHWGTELSNIEDFERGDFSMFDWHLDSTYPWEITTTNPYEGNYCMMSSNYHVPSSTSTMEAIIHVPSDGHISFFSKVSSENNYDYGYFYIDGVQKGSYSGNGSWGEKTFTVTAGVHAFKWAYTKDISVNSYDDRFYVDYIRFYSSDGFAYDFEDSKMPHGWTTIDADGDGWDWMLAEAYMAPCYGHNGSTDMVISQSYNPAVGILHPDNYLVSEQVAFASGSHFSFYACAQDANWAAEHFGVFVSVGSNFNPSDFQEVQSWTMTSKGGGRPIEGKASRDGGTRTQGTWYYYDVDLSAYAGQFGYIAIRHYDCSDMFYLDVDDIAFGNSSKSGGNPTYRVYRANCDGSGMQMIADNVTGNYYIDGEWEFLPMGSYKYGVSTFSVGRESAISWVETENGNTQPLTVAEAEAMGIELSPTASQAPMDGNPSGYRATWDLLGSYSCTTAYQYGVATDGQYIYHSAWSSNAGFMFAKYDMQGNFIETFEVEGCGYLRDLTYDGQYFYGGATGSVLYCVDLANQTLISTTTTSCNAIRYCAYDPVRDGFWVGNWSTAIKFIDRSGNTLITGPNGMSFGGAAYYRDEDDVEHIYFSAQPSYNAVIYDYDIATNTLSSSYIFDVGSNLSGASGTAGGCFIGEYMGRMAFFADLQQEPNMVGIFELKDASAWSNCIDKLYAAQTINLVAGWNWWSTYVDITLADLKAALVAALPGTTITISSQNSGSTTYNGSTWRGQLSTLDVTQMYKIKTTADCQFVLTGEPLNPAEHPITIHNGTNWIGFPLNVSKSLSNAFAGFAVSGDIVRSKNGSATYTNLWRGTLNTLVPGQGYIYKSASSTTRVLSFAQFEYVDLGLPSGLLWATCNVGANSPEDYGDYFAWGETQPKDTYSYGTYQYCMGSVTSMTKYCSNSNYGYNGFTDNLTTLEPSDDAAKVNWGNGWRMPTDEEWQELLDNTTVTWTTQNGVNGLRFTASNGNSIFLPAAGYHSGSDFVNPGSNGKYWSSSLNTNYPNGAMCIHFESDDYFMGGFARFYGESVRPVRSGTN